MLSVDFSVVPWLITIPKADLTLVTGTKYNLDVDVFWNLLTDYADSPEGVAYPVIYNRIPATSSTPSITDVNTSYYVLQFEDGLYSVSVINGNTNIRDAEVKNQVSVGTNNTTGFIDANFLEYSTFNGGVSLDTINGVSGVNYPIGTPSLPSNNLTEALLIAESRGFTVIKVIGDYTFDVSDVVTSFKFIGESPNLTLLTLTEAASVTSCVFENLTAVGTLDGGCDLFQCHVTTLNYVDGSVRECQLDEGVMTLSGTQAELVRCWSGVAGTDMPEVNLGGTGTDLLVRDYQGGIELSNYTSGVNNISIDMASGHIKLASSIISGAFLIRGIGKLTDLSIGAAVNSDDLINKALLTEITDLVTDLREENPTTQEITKKVWKADLIDFDEEESAGYMLLNTSEVVEQNLVTPEQLATAVWSKDMTAAFGLNTSGGILKKIKLIQQILLA